MPPAAFFAAVNEKARRASRKLLARQEVETLWETQEVETALCNVLDMELPEVPTKTAEELDDSKLTCEEYVAYITVEVVGNMDAIAWARVNRKTGVFSISLCLDLSVSLSLSLSLFVSLSFSFSL